MDRIFSKLDRDLTSEFSEEDIIEWTGEALEFMQAVRAYEETVAFIEVKNHQCPVPKGMHGIIQIARNNTYTCPTSDCCNPAIVTSCINDTGCVPTVGVNPCVCPPSDAVWLDCNGQPIVAYDLAYYRPYFDLRLESFNTFANTNYYKSNYTPIRLATSSMFSGIECGSNPNPYHSCKDEYNLIQGTTLRFSFQQGAVAVAYLKQIVDIETGYPMIPDSISHITAVVSYIIYKKFSKEFYRGRDGADRKMAKAEQDWQWYCGQATSNDKMITGLDEHQNFLDQRQYMLPRLNQYYGFFGNLNEPEQRVWNNRFRGSADLFRGEGVIAIG